MHDNIKDKNTISFRLSLLSLLFSAFSLSCKKNLQNVIYFGTIKFNHLLLLYSRNLVAFC